MISTMEIKDLHHLVFDELGINPELLRCGGNRTDNIVVKYARIIFCGIAKETGLKTGEIAFYLFRDDSTVNKDLRDLNDIRLKSDFFSTGIIAVYNKILSKIHESN